jgi:hypothetical protein
MKNAVFWDVAACRSCVNRRFEGTYRLHLQETSVHTRSTRRHIPEDGILHSYRRENLKSYITKNDWHLLQRNARFSEECRAKQQESILINKIVNRVRKPRRLCKIFGLMEENEVIPTSLRPMLNLTDFCGLEIVSDGKIAVKAHQGSIWNSTVSNQTWTTTPSFELWFRRVPHFATEQSVMVYFSLKFIKFLNVEYSLRFISLWSFIADTNLVNAQIDISPCTSLYKRRIRNTCKFRASTGSTCFISVVYDLRTAAFYKCN